MAPGLAASTEASQPPLKNPTIVVKTSLLMASVYAISMGLLYYHRKWFATWYHTVTKSCDGSIQEMALVNEMISSTRHNKNEYVQPVT
jgi:endonuclease I